MPDFERRPLLGYQVGGVLANALFSIGAEYGDEVGEAAEALATADSHLAEGKADDAVQSAAKAQELFRKDGNDAGTADAVMAMINAHKLSADLSVAKPEKALSMVKSELTTYNSKNDKLGAACMKLARAELNAHASKRSVDLEAALTDAEEAFDYFKTEDNDKMQAFSQLVLVNIYIQNKRSGDAQEAAASALNFFSALNDKSGQAKALHGRAVAFALCEDFANAVKSAQKASALYADLAQTHDQAFELSCIAQWHISHGKPQAAMEAARKAYGLVPKPRALCMMVEAAVASGRAAQAERLATEALRKFRTTDNAVDVVSGMAIQLFAQSAGASPQDALDTARDAIRTAQGYSNKELELNLMYAVCEANIKTQRVEAAAKNMRDASALARGLGDSSEEGDALRMLAHALSTVQEIEEGSTIIDEGMEAAQSARALYNETGRIVDEASAVLLQAQLKNKQGDPGACLYLAEEAKALYEKAGYNLGLHAVSRIIIEFYIAMSRHADAMDLVDTLVQNSKSTGHKKILSDAMYSLADLQVMFGEMDNAKETIQEGIVLCQAVGNKECAARLAILETQLAYQDLNRNGQDTALRLSTLKVAESAVLAAKQSGDKTFYGVALTWRAQVLTTAQRGNDALESTQMSEKAFAQAGGDNYGNQVRAQVGVAQLFLALGRKEEAKEAAEKAAKMCEISPEFAEDQYIATQVLEAMIERKPQMVEMYGDGGGGYGGGDPNAPPQWDPNAVAQWSGGGDSAQIEEAPAPVGFDYAYIRPRLMEMVMNVLSEEGEVEDDSPFMEAGIDSLGSVQLLTDVGMAFGLQLSPSAIFDYPSVRELTEHLVEETAGG